LKTLTVIVPSRSQPEQLGFLRRSVGSVAQQQIRGNVNVDVIVGLDPDATPPRLDELGIPVRFEQARSRSQAAALNAAAAALHSDYVAFLEDDDLWSPTHLGTALESLSLSGFVSGTQLEIDTSGAVIRINDFPTPSGWVMSRATWDSVGPFDASFRYHLDNDWLGRLAARAIRRIHLVEATAPVSLAVARQVRPWLANVLTCSRGAVTLHRHASPVPLIMRLVHPQSGLYSVNTDPAAQETSRQECARLEQLYDLIPW